MAKSARDKEYLLVVFQAASMFIVVPIAYALVAYFIKESQPVTKPQNPSLLYGLLGLSLLILFVVLPFLTKYIPSKNQQSITGKSPVQIAYTIRLALVESVFIFGLLHFFITWEVTPFYYFYAIGAVGVLLHWPTRERFDTLADQLEAK